MAVSEDVKTIAFIGETDSCVGFLLAGIGEVKIINDKNSEILKNYLVVDDQTSLKEIEDQFQCLVKRNDVGIVLIEQHIANQIRCFIDRHSRQCLLPTVLELPSTYNAYDLHKDYIIKRIPKCFLSVLIGNQMSLK